MKKPMIGPKGKVQEALRRIFDVEGRNVLITGANGFLGRYIAQTFLEAGAKVILLSRSSQLEGLAKDFRKKFGKGQVSAFQVDFYKRNKLKQVLNKIVKTSRVDVLVNNAYDLSPKTGFNIPAGRLERADYSQWKAAFEAGIYWAALTTQIIGSQFQKRNKGNIINISSMYGLVSPNPRLYEGTEFFNPPTYGVVKAGLIALTKYTASFWGCYGIRCNALVLGAFPNVERKSANSVNPEDISFLEKVKRNTLLNRVGHPHDLRGGLIFLASDASSFMTGQTLVIDGGWTTT